MQFEVKSIHQISNSKARRHELSGKEPVSQVIRLYDKSQPLSREIILKLLKDMNFNTSVLFGSKHESDIAAVTNIRGFMIPGLDFISTNRHLFGYLAKYGPGKYRLHLRLYEEADGSWIMTSHVDWNWLNISNPRKIYVAHFKKGTGNYTEGTEIMLKLLDRYLNPIH